MNVSILVRPVAKAALLCLPQCLRLLQLPGCVFEQTKPQWVGRDTSVAENQMYHMIRALHMAGRCVECGECERVCPVDIPLMLLNEKLSKT